MVTHVTKCLLLGNIPLETSHEHSVEIHKCKHVLVDTFCIERSNSDTHVVVQNEKYDCDPDG